MKASLIIIPRKPNGELLDLSKGTYEFGISLVNSTEIIESTYQYSNRFDGLSIGRYYWAIRNKTSFNIAVTGYNDVLPYVNTNGCKTIPVYNLNYIEVPKSDHLKERVSNVTCYDLDENNTYSEFIPDSIEVRETDLTVIVKTYLPFTGKLEIC